MNLRVLVFFVSIGLSVSASANWFEGYAVESIASGSIATAAVGQGEANHQYPFSSQDALSRLIRLRLLLYRKLL